MPFKGSNYTRHYTGRNDALRSSYQQRQDHWNAGSKNHPGAGREMLKCLWFYNVVRCSNGVDEFQEIQQQKDEWSVCSSTSEWIRENAQ
jgi:hypothetical protein